MTQTYPEAINGYANAVSMFYFSRVLSYVLLSWGDGKSDRRGRHPILRLWLNSSMHFSGSVCWSGESHMHCREERGWGTPLGSKFPSASYSLGMVFSSSVEEGSGKGISNLE